MDEQMNETAVNESNYQDLVEFYRKMGMEEKGIDNFFLEIIRTNNTIKVGNLEEDELGKPRIPIRTMLKLKEDCRLIPSMSSFTTDFENQVENVLASSLSKEGFLIKARITQKKELLDNKKKKRSIKTLFGRKEVEEDE